MSQIYCFFFFVRLSAFLRFEFQRRGLRGTTREEPLNATEGGLSLRSPFTVFSPAKEKPYLIWFDSSDFCYKKKKGKATPCGFFSGLEHPFCLVVAHFKENVRRPFCVCLFVRSFVLLLALLFVQNVSLSWWMYRAVTTYLPALVWICCFYVFFFSFGGTGGTGRIPGLKKEKKRLDQYCIPCNLCNCWL